MNLDDFRQRLDRIVAEFGGDRRAFAGGLRSALVDAKVAVGTIRDGLTVSERELEQQRRHLADAERRRELAANINDAETVIVAERFIGKHRDRVGLLERKVAVQQEELRMAEAQLDELTEMYRAAQHGVPPGVVASGLGRGTGEGGGEAPGEAGEGDLDPGRDQREFERQAKAAAVEAQLAALKRKLGRQ